MLYRGLCAALIASTALGASSLASDVGANPASGVCGRGYVQEMTMLSTHGGKFDATSMFVYLDTAGFKPSDYNDSAYEYADGLYWITYNWGHNVDQWDLLRSTLQAAMLGRLPVRIYSTTNTCELTPDTGYIRVCTTKKDCDN